MKEYKDTLNLPETTFPMKASLTQNEPKTLEFWKEIDAYAAMVEANSGNERFVLHDGPPYANGHIHLGTALNKILKDIIVKSRNLQGKKAEYVPGWDCHGLPVEHKVAEKLGEKAKTLPTHVVRKECRAWANKFLDIQREEFKRIHEEIMAQAQRHDRSIGALGSRWGLQSEKAFRDALAGILEKNFGVQVFNINEYDDQGTVFGRPDQIELDVIIQNGLLLICELKSSIDKAGMYIFERKARFYEQRHQRTANRLIVISPMIDARARQVAERLGIETYGDSLEVQAL